jgi:hypothetical protein
LFQQAQANGDRLQHARAVEVHEAARRVAQEGRARLVARDCARQLVVCRVAHERLQLLHVEQDELVVQLLRDGLVRAEAVAGAGQLHDGAHEGRVLVEEARHLAERHVE